MEEDCYTVEGEVVSLHKAWLSWGDSYELSIADRVDEKMALAVVLAIDCVLEAQAENTTEEEKYLEKVYALVRKRFCLAERRLEGAVAVCHLKDMFFCCWSVIH